MKAKQSFVNKLTITIVILLTVVSIQAKDKEKEKYEPFYKPSEEKKERTSRNVIKLNATQLFLTNPTIQYECGIQNNISIGISGSMLIPRNVPRLFFKPDEDKVEGWQTPKFGGWAVTPEFRFYPGAKQENQAPHGFYIGPYVRYSSFALKADYYDIGVENGTQFDRVYNMKAKYSGTTVGLMLGSQWIINKHFSFDWWIFGMGGGSSKFQIEVVSKDGALNLTGQQQDDLRADIVNNLDELGKFGKGNYTIETTTNSAKLTVKGIPMTSVRAFGFCFGYAF